MKTLTNLITGRALLVAFVGACLVAGRRFGVVIPEGTEADISKVLDTGLSFAGFLVFGTMLHKSAVPSDTGTP